MNFEEIISVFIFLVLPVVFLGVLVWAARRYELAHKKKDNKHIK